MVIHVSASPEDAWDAPTLASAEVAHRLMARLAQSAVPFTAHPLEGGWWSLQVPQGRSATIPWRIWAIDCTLAAIPAPGKR
jgi:hypothetical protein